METPRKSLPVRDGRFDSHQSQIHILEVPRKILGGETFAKIWFLFVWWWIFTWKNDEIRQPNPFKKWVAVGLPGFAVQNLAELGVQKGGEVSPDKNGWWIVRDSHDKCPKQFRLTAYSIAYWKSPRFLPIGKQTYIWSVFHGFMLHYRSVWIVLFHMLLRLSAQIFNFSIKLHLFFEYHQWENMFGHAWLFFHGGTRTKTISEVL